MIDLLFKKSRIIIIIFFYKNILYDKKTISKKINSNKLLTIVTIANSNISELNKTYQSLRKNLYIDENLVEWLLIISGDFNGIRKNNL